MSLGVPLQMANHRRLIEVIRYLCESAEDECAEFQFDITSSPSDAAGNHLVEIKLKSRVPSGAADAIRKGYDDLRQLMGYGAIRRGKEK